MSAGWRGALPADRAGLVADCSRCAGWCCVVPAFTASADFALDKPAGRPCPHLGADSRCGIHDRLRERGFPGCTAYDCFGAGQAVTSIAVAGRDRRAEDHPAEDVVAVFTRMRELHELVWYLVQALELPAAGPLRTELAAMLGQLRALGGEPVRVLAGVDLDGHRAATDALLQRVSALARDDHGRTGKQLRRRDLIGRDLRGADLRAADLRGAYLIAADLRAADLRGADLIGADLRAADLSGADLRGALFLTRQQVGAARGDRGTRLPDVVDRPAHWAAGERGELCG